MEICLLYSLQIFNQGKTEPKSRWAPGNWCLKFSNARLVFVTDKSHCHCQNKEVSWSQGGAGAVASLASDALLQHLSEQSRTGLVTVTMVSRKPRDAQKSLQWQQQVHGQCRNPSQQRKVKNSEHRGAYNRASEQLWIQRGEAINKASPKSCPRLHQVRADLHRSRWAPREEAKWLQSPSVLSGPQQQFWSGEMSSSLGQNISSLHIFIKTLFRKVIIENWCLANIKTLSIRIWQRMHFIWSAASRWPSPAYGLPCYTVQGMKPWLISNEFFLVIWWQIQGTTF